MLGICYGNGMESELEEMIRWHLADLSYKAPEVAQNRAFHADGHLVGVMVDGQVFIDGAAVDQTEIDRIREG